MRVNVRASTVWHDVKGCLSVADTSTIFIIIINIANFSANQNPPVGPPIGAKDVAAATPPFPGMN